jgi:cytochrome c-type biogenesis protein
MDYFISFLEGIITFISPCLLPMLPVYISYFAGQRIEGKRSAALTNAVGFVTGFTLVFMTLGAFAGGVGRILREYAVWVNLISGLIVILFGLNFMEVIRIPFLNRNRGITLQGMKTGFFSSLVFGVIFSIGWTPCVGAFLGSALMLAASSGESLRGIFMLLSFSAGLGICFIFSAVLIDQLKSAFDFIKKNYRVINLISGGLLVVVGVLMATGLMGYFLSFFSL